jgi:methyl-accepting chemotaxis protein
MTQEDNNYYELYINTHYNLVTTKEYFMGDAKVKKKVKAKSLKRKILLYFLVTMAVIFVAVGTVVIVDVSDVVHNLNEGLTKQVVNARADEIGKYVQGLQYDIKTRSEQNLMMTGNVEAIQSDLVARQSTIRADFEMTLYADLDGNFYSSLGGTGTIADRPYFQEIVSGGKDEVISDPVESRATGKTIFVVAHAVKNAAGKTNGVLAATVLLDTFNEVVKDIKIGDAGYPWISDGTGLVIAHPSDDIRLKLNTLDSDKSSFSGLAAIGQNMKSGKGGAGEYTNAAGEQYYAIYTPIPHTPNWSMAYSISTTEMMAPVTNMVTLVVIIVGICLIVVAGVTFLIAGRLVKPIKKSAELAKALAAGDLEQPSTVKSNDEVGQLAGILDNEVRSAFKSIEQARVISEKQAQYQAAEVDKLLVALRRLSRGELGFDLTVSEGDADTEQLHELFSEIAENLGGALQEIRAYIAEISTVLGEMAQGHMDVGITAEYRGEFTALKDSINGIVTSLNDVLSEIGIAADQVASGTRQVSDGSQEISQGATEQASAIEQLTASVSQIAEQTRSNAVSANKANELTIAAASEATLGNERMNAMQQAMDEINEASNSISKVIKIGRAHV